MDPVDIELPGIETLSALVTVSGIIVLGVYIPKLLWDCCFRQSQEILAVLYEIKNEIADLKTSLDQLHGQNTFVFETEEEQEQEQDEGMSEQSEQSGQSGQSGQSEQSEISSEDVDEDAPSVATDESLETMVAPLLAETTAAAVATTVSEQDDKHALLRAKLADKRELCVSYKKTTFVGTYEVKAAAPNGYVIRHNNVEYLTPSQFSFKLKKTVNPAISSDNGWDTVYLITGETEKGKPIKTSLKEFINQA